VKITVNEHKQTINIHHVQENSNTFLEKHRL